MKKFLEDNLELLLYLVNKRQQKYTVLGPSGLPIGVTENFAFVNIEYRFEIDLLFFNPNIGSKNLDMGKLNGSRWESADAHSHAGIPVGTGVSELWD